MSIESRPATDGVAPTVQPKVQSRRPRRLQGLSRTRERDEEGAILILALAFILVVSLIAIALSTWATNDLNNTTSFANVRALDYSATSVTQIAIQSIRFKPIPTTTPTKNVPTPVSYCWDPTGTSPSPYASYYLFDNVTVAVWCSTVENNNLAMTRVVTFYSCPTTTAIVTSWTSLSLANAAGSTCAANPTLTATVNYDDYPANGGPPLVTQCTASCGLGVTLVRWVWAQ
jgi:hypothetical protein